jgi:hypothetical protein
MEGALHQFWVVLNLGASLVPACACPGTKMCPAATGGGAARLRAPAKNHAFCSRHAGPGMDARIRRFLRKPAQVERTNIKGSVPARDEIGNQPGGRCGESQSKMLVTDCVEEVLPTRGATDAGKIVRQSRAWAHPARPVRIAPVTQRPQPCSQARWLTRIRWRVEPRELEVTRGP